MCIASDKTLADPKRLRHDTDKLYVMSPDEMSAALPDFPEAVANTHAHRRDVQRRAEARQELPPHASSCPRA